MWLLYYLKLKRPVDWVTQSRLVLLCLVLGNSHFHVRYEVSACYVCNLCLLTPQVNPALVVNINFVKPKSTKSDAKNASANQKTVYHKQQLSANDLYQSLYRVIPSASIFTSVPPPSISHAPTTINSLNIVDTPATVDLSSAVDLPVTVDPPTTVDAPVIVTVYPPITVDLPATVDPPTIVDLPANVQMLIYVLANVDLPGSTVVSGSTVAGRSLFAGRSTFIGVDPLTTARAQSSTCCITMYSFGKS